jgi:hypothetical protein
MNCAPTAPPVWSFPGQSSRPYLLHLNATPRAKMSSKPIFVATHPRACSTAFERVFMTRRNTIQTAHEPFGDAYYFGPERLAERYEHDPKSREESGYAESTYRAIFDRIASDNSQVRLFPWFRFPWLKFPLLSPPLSFLFRRSSHECSSLRYPTI